jgi:co-chaperonin GroES (HSP10)|tara:strand:+ start:445 stop:864 length:420 start_codon:yes stop_codon:yes gene_type:complete
MTTLAKEVENPVIDVEDITFKDVDDPTPSPNQLPDPKGYKLLIALPEVKEATESGIIKSAQSQHEETISTVVGFVLKMGPDAYASYARFPSGPYCRERDWVVFRAFSGTRIKIHGKEFRLINDDTVEAVVEDPRGVERA